MTLKRDLIAAKKSFQDSLDELEKLMNSDGLREKTIIDGDWGETGYIVIGTFVPRANNFIKKVNRFIDMLPSNRGRPKKVK